MPAVGDAGERVGQREVLRLDELVQRPLVGLAEHPGQLEREQRRQRGPHHDQRDDRSGQRRQQPDRRHLRQQHQARRRASRAHAQRAEPPDQVERPRRGDALRDGRREVAHHHEPVPHHHGRHADPLQERSVEVLAAHDRSLVGSGDVDAAGDDRKRAGVAEDRRRRWRGPRREPRGAHGHRRRLSGPGHHYEPEPGGGSHPIESSGRCMEGPRRERLRDPEADVLGHPFLHAECGDLLDCQPAVGLAYGLAAGERVHHDRAGKQGRQHERGEERGQPPPERHTRDIGRTAPAP